MTSRHSPPKRVFVGLCAVSFLAASGMVPFGHYCPHHDLAGAAGEGARPAVHQAGFPAAHDAGSPAAGSPVVGSRDDGSHGADGPCTCVGNCHASADTPVPPTPDTRVSTQAVGRASAGLPKTEKSLLGPRHGPFALHLPNAPPAAL